MLIFFPYRVDVPHEHRPVVNWVVLAATVLVFWLQMSDPSITRQYWLDGWGIRGLLGSIWLHGGIWHLFWNSIALWVFGNAVCSKLGNLAYVPVYVGLGVAGGIGHLLFSDGPAVGASGAISGLIGIHLVLFPENTISCVLWTIFVPLRAAWFSFRSFWFILFWFALNLYGAIRGGGNIGYSAHIGGFVAGAGLALFLLKTGSIRMERYERSILSLLGLEDKRTRSPDSGGGDRRHRSPAQETTERVEAHRAESKVGPGRVEPQFIRFKCNCGQPIKVPWQYGGRTGRCPKCGQRTKIPLF